MTADLATTHAAFVAEVLDVDLDDCGCCVEILAANGDHGMIVPDDGYLVMSRDVYTKGVRRGDCADQ